MYWRYIESVIGATSIPALKGEAGRGKFTAPKIRFSWIFHIRRATPISGVRIVAPIVLAQHEEHERIGEARTPVRRASPIVIELTY